MSTLSRRARGFFVGFDGCLEGGCAS